MNVAAHQELEKNGKVGKRKVGKERKRGTDFKEAVCCPSAVAKGTVRQRMVCVRGVPRVNGTLGKAKSHLNPTQTGSGTAPPRLGGC